MDATTAIGLGIVSGIITTLIIVVFRQIWLHVIEPWWEDRLYKDIRIEGRWRSTTDYGEFRLTELYNLSRNGHRVIGTATVLEGDPESQGETYKIEGIFKNTILTASYCSTDSSQMDRGTYTMLLKNNGWTFEGYGAFYYDPTHTIKTVHCTWQKEH